MNAEHQIIMDPIADIHIDEHTTAAELVKHMHDSGGFMAKNLGISVDILERMQGGLRFLSFPADIISTGARGIIADMLKAKLFDVVIATCGMLDHDIARSKTKYYHGAFEADDSELREQNINRLGNIFIPNSSYGEIIEDTVKPWLKEIARDKPEFGSYELCKAFGERITDENSILYWAAKNDIPIIIPGLTDGSIGYQLWEVSQTTNIKWNPLMDEQLLSDKVWNAEKTGALIIGGGISKHHVIWWNQFKGLDDAVYITTAQEYDGSLSGAQPREAVSWGKIKAQAHTITVYSDATIALPLIWAGLKGRLKV